MSQAQRRPRFHLSLNPMIELAHGHKQSGNKDALLNFTAFGPFALFFGLGPGFFLTGLGSLSSLLFLVSEVFLGLGLGLGPGFFLTGGAASGPSYVSESQTDLHFVDRVLCAGTARDGGKASSSSEGGAMGVGEVGNSRGSSDFEEDGGLDSG
jgi:hypothetical protein